MSINDPARLIWGDAVIDEAERINDTTWTGDNGANIAGWLHASGSDPGDRGLCCIVGHLNWIAAEQAGKNPAELGMATWPSTGEAVDDLLLVKPDAPREISINGVTVDTYDVIDWMINNHDRMAIKARKDAGWWGEKLTDRIVSDTMNIAWSRLAKIPKAAPPPPVEEPETVLVEEAVPVLVAR